MNTNCCAITGHRPHKLIWGQDEEALSCLMFKKALETEISLLIDKGYYTHLIGLCWGIDLIYGEMIAALKAKYPNLQLIGVIPHEEQHIKWHITYQGRYFNLIDKCDDIIQLNMRYHEGCYKEKNHYLVKNSQHLTAVYNGHDEKSGTYQTINMAKKQGREITIIDPHTLDVQRIQPFIRILK